MNAMPMKPSAKPLAELVSAEALAEINRWIAKYPPERRQSAVIQTLHIVQDQHGWLSNELMDAVAGYLSMPKIAVYEVATFYSMFNLKPCGKHTVAVCTNISCMLRGSDAIVRHLEKKLGVPLGQTTPDGKFTIKEVECLAACGGAPMFQIGKTYYENLTPAKVDEILDKLS